MNHELKKKISTSLAIAVLSLGIISAAEAAEAVDMPAGISVENTDIKDERKLQVEIEHFSNQETLSIA